MFEIIPSIWLINGKCVRLKRGDFSTEEVISDNPLEIAQAFQDHGISKLHLVDLDGAVRESPKNYHILEAIVQYTSLKVDFTGGVSTDGDVIKAFEHGASSVTAATVAVRFPERFAQWLISYGREKINLAADSDSRDLSIKIKGWQTKTTTQLFDHLTFFFERGLKYAKCSDISRDGLMDGPNFELYEELANKFPSLHILASGGVRDISDFNRLKDLGVSGVVFGRAFYEKKITLKDLDNFLATTTN
ncbi:1-(5-phosphoribosyl)-5-[(5-phosphoribosylamino)methylideneamino]imidazole-4-carboxamide isomerase [Pleomorphovibrio marinus]|uniref:1-(5-phosphoribosyl)-5-[(5- phosphoribosylamino)methylideneamino]imidazole-4- carboxamide isomerase n=1 Tax=Pleomorphovibrio marinus TaxID=2164132 RepID=UPI000E0C7A9D|nr:1-(5-phosphoribosyl)-5-[(5-phosphoribosylamino)methylideneamino] imidazole-4-carboxamide isomerase [Pleomorphovibrio marinus]